ncbi:LysR family transcriptional regulator [Roseomonas frigidaquae]|uniref:LysR family transcriptional regulator n=1 Tax=Falsiroseomonas frigidaquae TaxID=487318 RepID=A0ABX1EUP2_9PROT|nr:LysR family transcriptional regulator [Falsiroseomonas frigidaquae]NKE44048.1 LysR family transcriptional regulator [Falsiroseomonas frigidaquae]
MFAMYLDLPGLEAFIAVAELGSFRRAASRLGLSQPALTRRVQRLEGVTGAELLDRRAQPIRLTAAGTSLLPEAQEAIARLREAMRRAVDPDRGQRVEIGCLPTLAVRHLGPVLAAHARAWPDSEVVVHESSATEIRSMLEANRIDFALAAIGAERWNVERVPLFDEPFFLVVPADHRLAQRGSAAWAELRDEKMVSTHAISENRRLVDAALDQARVPTTWRVEVRHLATAIAMVAAGAGIVALPASALPEPLPASLATLRLVRPALTRRVGLLSPRERQLSPAARNLMSSIVEALRRADGAPRARAEAAPKARRGGLRKAAPAG